MLVVVNSSEVYHWELFFHTKMMATLDLKGGQLYHFPV